MRTSLGKVSRAPRRRLLGLAAATVVAGLPGTLGAQSAESRTDQASRILAHPLGARTMALGGADVAIAEPEAFVANPSLLLTARGLTGSAQWSGGRGGGATGSALAAVTAVGPVTFGVAARQGRTEDTRSRFDAEDGDAASTALTLGAARTVRGQRLGLATTLVDDGGHQTLAIDAGYQRPLWMGVLGTALSVSNGHDDLDGPAYAEDDLGHRHGSHERAWSSRAAAGWFASRAVSVAWDLSAGVQASVWSSGEVQPIGSLEASWVPIQGVAITTRGGVRVPRRDLAQGATTLGLGIAVDHLFVDYALAPGWGARRDDEVRAIHRIGIRIR